MKNKIDTVIVGATYFGIGYASAHPNCMIIESSQILGGDFHHSGRTADVRGIGEKEGATDLGKLMQELQIWENDKFDVLKASPAIHKYVCETNEDINILLDAKIISIDKAADGCSVKYMDNEGIHQVHCNKMLDTTMCRDTYPAGAVCTAKTLNLFTVNVTEDFESKLKAVCPECQIEEGKNEREKIVKIPFDPAAKMLDAYGQMIEIWKHAFPAREEKILFVAEDFEYTCEERSDNSAPCAWNGGRFANPLTAFVEGMQYSFSQKKVKEEL